jgi:DNA-binding transcriptional LysR family regulator
MVSGMLRVTAPVSFGDAMIAPKLMQFLDRHPLIQADLHFSDDRINLIAEGFDVSHHSNPSVSCVLA